MHVVLHLLKDQVQIFDKKVNQLQLDSAKLNSNEGKAALQPLGVLFSNEELINSNPKFQQLGKKEKHLSTEP